MKYVFIIILVLTAGQVFTQPLPVGKSFPYHDQLQVSNFGRNNISIPELKGKYVIIDFFSSSCIACFKSMPKINDLQQQFKSDLTFLLVGAKDAVINDVYEKFRKKFSLNLAVAFDSIIVKKAGLQAFPTYVWIDDKGIIVRVTGAAELTESNITLFLEDKSLDEIATPNTKDTMFLVKSLLTIWHAGMKSSFPPSVPQRASSFQVLGITPVRLYKYAYLGSSNWLTTSALYGNVYPHAIWEDSDSIVSDQVSDSERYSYSLLMKLQAEKKKLQEIMQQDIDRYFPLKAKVERRLMPCWNLILTDGDTSLLSSKYKSYAGVQSFTNLDVKHFPIASLISFIQSLHPFSDPFINETGINTYVDISLEGVLTDMAELKKALRHNGLDLVRGYRPMKVLVLHKPEKSVVARME